jgi:tRNA nucleotidyltransferase/poly(A) polymerase
MRFLVLKAVPAPVGRLWHRLADAATTWLVGGAVRDLALGLTPTDFDLATALPPEDAAAVAAHAGYRVVRSGQAFGSLHVMTEAGGVDVTTFRREGAYLDGRHPGRLTWTDDGRADLARRDFTVNAMAVDVKGRLQDPEGGWLDLQRRCLRTVGDASVRVAEDRLRGVRAVRFLAYPPGDWSWDPDLARELHRWGAELAAVGPGRLAAEWRVILQKPFPERALEGGADLGLWPRWPAGAPPLGAADTPAERLALMEAVAFRLGLDWEWWPRPWTREARQLLSALARGRSDPHRFSHVEHLARLLRRPWRPAPVDGRELMAVLGLPPGPLVGAVQRALDAWAAALAEPPDKAAALAQAQLLLRQIESKNAEG